MKNWLLLTSFLVFIPTNETFAAIISIVQRSHGVGDTPNSYGYGYRYSGYGDVATSSNVVSDSSTTQVAFVVAGGEAVGTWNASNLTFPLPNNYTYAGMAMAAERNGISNAFTTDAPFDTSDISAFADFRIAGFPVSSVNGTMFVNFRNATDTLLAQYVNDATITNSTQTFGGSLSGFSNIVNDLTQAEAALVTKITIGFEVTGPSNFAGFANLQMIGDNFQLTFNQVVAVPEPNSIALSGIVGIGLVFVRRFRRGFIG